MSRAAIHKWTPSPFRLTRTPTKRNCAKWGSAHHCKRVTLDVNVQGFALRALVSDHHDHRGGVRVRPTSVLHPTSKPPLQGCTQNPMFLLAVWTDNTHAPRPPQSPCSAYTNVATIPAKGPTPSMPSESEAELILFGRGICAMRRNRVSRKKDQNFTAHRPWCCGEALHLIALPTCLLRSGHKHGRTGRERHGALIRPLILRQGSVAARTCAKGKGLRPDKMRQSSSDASSDLKEDPGSSRASSVSLRIHHVAHRQTGPGLKQARSVVLAAGSTLRLCPGRW